MDKKEDELLPEIGGEFDDQGNLILVLTCGRCRRVHKRKFAELVAGSVIDCPCDAHYQISNDELREAQEALDKFKKSLDDLDLNINLKL